MQSPPIVLALDCPRVSEAVRLAEKTRSAVGMMKVGLELFVEAGPSAVKAISDAANLPIFLDLKLHDIPETVARAVGRAAELGVHMLTVHAQGGAPMLQRARAQAERDGNRVELVAVTVLTSFNEADLHQVGVSRDVSSHAILLAQMAYSEGIRSFVCSPHEVASMRTTLGSEAILITPGVRPKSHATSDDQKRVAGPSEAIRNGANWLVIGRPIRDAVDPLAAAQAIATEIASLSHDEGIHS